MARKQLFGTKSLDVLLAEMAELKSRLRNGLDQAERAGNMAAFVAFAREHRQCLESYFEMADRIASKVRLGADGRGLAEIVAEARKRVAVARGFEAVSCNHSGETATAASEPPDLHTSAQAPATPSPADAPTKPHQERAAPSAPVYDDWVARLL